MGDKERVHDCRLAARYTVKYRDGAWRFCVGVDPFSYEVGIDYCPWCGAKLSWIEGGGAAREAKELWIDRTEGPGGMRFTVRDPDTSKVLMEVPGHVLQSAALEEDVEPAALIAWSDGKVAYIGYQQWASRKALYQTLVEDRR